MKHEDFLEKLQREGWTIYPNHMKRGEILLAKHFNHAFECHCNNKGGVQIVIEVYAPCDYRPDYSYTVDLTAEKGDGVWVKLQCYGLSSKEIYHKLGSQLEQLLKAWEAMNQ